MNVSVVVDIGNSRMKWGRIIAGELHAIEAMSIHDESQWQDMIDRWQLAHASWLVASVVPSQSQRIAAWLSECDHHSHALSNQQLLEAVTGQFRTAVAEPERIGIDRLLNAYAASRITPPSHPTVAVSVGTAMTLDLVVNGVHEGGAILPGPRLMAASLRTHTAQLPEVGVEIVDVNIGQHTEQAIALGIQSALCGAAGLLVHRWTDRRATPWIHITGGDGHLIGDDAFAQHVHVVRHPALTLEGLRLVAERLA